MRCQVHTLFSAAKVLFLVLKKAATGGAMLMLGWPQVLLKYRVGMHRDERVCRLATCLE